MGRLMPHGVCAHGSSPLRQLVYTVHTGIFMCNTLLCRHTRTPVTDAVCHACTVRTHVRCCCGRVRCTLNPHIPYEAMWTHAQNSTPAAGAVLGFSAATDALACTHMACFGGFLCALVPLESTWDCR